MVTVGLTKCQIISGHHATTINVWWWPTGTRSLMSDFFDTIHQSTSVNRSGYMMTIITRTILLLTHTHMQWMEMITQHGERWQVCTCMQLLKFCYKYSSHCLDIQSGDYFGLDLLLPIPVPVLYRLIISQPTEYFVSTAIQTSTNGKTWVLYSLRVYWR